MADISVEQKSRGEAGQNSWIWALVAILAVGGLMGWLATRPVITPPVAVEGTGTDTGTTAFGSGGEAVELAALGQAPDSYTGRTVTVRGASVAASLGSRAFWADVPGANPFLVVLGPSVNVGAPAAGQSYDLTGNVEPVTEERIAEWVTAQTINAGAADEASFATHYLLASEAQQAGGAAAAPGGS